MVILIKDYYGNFLEDTEFEILKSIEGKISNPIPLIPEYRSNIVKFHKIGYYSTNGKIVYFSYSTRDSNTSIKEFPLEITKLTNLKRLCFSAPSITKVPKEISNLKTLQVLNLGSALNNLPESIKELKMLHTLFLQENNISLIPESIGNLNSLKVLQLSRNKINTLPKSFWKLKKLTTLYLRNNPINIIPENIGKLESLERLELDECDNITSLPSSLKNLKNLKIISFDGLQYSEFSEEIKKFLKEIERNGIKIEIR
jgi:hypothetical protein